MIWRKQHRVSLVLALPRPQWAWSLIPLGIGAHWMADDVYQHLKQKREPGYVSPVHRWYWAVLTWFCNNVPQGSWIHKALLWVRRH